MPTPMIGTSSTPRATRSTSAGNVSSLARSPVAPKMTMASGWSVMTVPLRMSSGGRRHRWGHNRGLIRRWPPSPTRGEWPSAGSGDVPDVTGAQAARDGYGLDGLRPPRRGRHPRGAERGCLDPLTPVCPAPAGRRDPGRADRCGGILVPQADRTDAALGVLLGTECAWLRWRADVVATRATHNRRPAR